MNWGEVVSDNSGKAFTYRRYTQPIGGKWNGGPGRVPYAGCARATSVYTRGQARALFVCVSVLNWVC